MMNKLDSLNIDSISLDKSLNDYFKNGGGV